MPPYANENYFRCGSKFTDYTTYGYEINQDGEIAFEKWQEDVQNFIKFFNNGFAPSNDSIPKEITLRKYKVMKKLILSVQTMSLIRCW